MIPKLYQHPFFLGKWERLKQDLNRVQDKSRDEDEMPTLEDRLNHNSLVPHRCPVLLSTHPQYCFSYLFRDVTNDTDRIPLPIDLKGRNRNLNWKFCSVFLDSLKFE
jgi:hypothetical protein